jgi:hypothetical protein
LLERSGQGFVSLFPGEAQGPPRRTGGFAESACFGVPRMVQKLDLTENTRYCQAGFEDAMPTLPGYFLVM